MTEGTGCDDMYEIHGGDRRGVAVGAGSPPRRDNQKTWGFRRGLAIKENMEGIIEAGIARFTPTVGARW